MTSTLRVKIPFLYCSSGTLNLKPKPDKNYDMLARHYYYFKGFHSVKKTQMYVNTAYGIHKCSHAEDVCCKEFQNYSPRKKATIHQVTTMLATSKNVIFPGHNHLLTTDTDDLSRAGARVIIKASGY